MEYRILLFLPRLVYFLLCFSNLAADSWSWLSASDWATSSVGAGVGGLLARSSSSSLFWRSCSSS